MDPSLPDWPVCSATAPLPPALASFLGGSFWAGAEAEKPVQAGIGSDFPAQLRKSLLGTPGPSGP